jgi:hypothetical protein
MGIVKLQGKRTLDGGCSSCSLVVSDNGKGKVGKTDVGLVIIEERIKTILALTSRAISTLVTRVTLTTKGVFGIPKLVVVVVVRGGKILNGTASTVSGTDTIRRDWARSALASGSLITIEALAFTSLTIADTLVGALHVFVTSVLNNGTSRVHHVGVFLGGAIRVDVIGVNDSDGREGKGITRCVQITLGGINVGIAELTDAL